jgi:hypothetical protein
LDKALEKEGLFPPLLSFVGLKVVRRRALFSGLDVLEARFDGNGDAEVEAEADSVKDGLGVLIELSALLIFEKVGRSGKGGPGVDSSGYCTAGIVPSPIHP